MSHTDRTTIRPSNLSSQNPRNLILKQISNRRSELRRDQQTEKTENQKSYGKNISEGQRTYLKLPDAITR